MSSLPTSAPVVLGPGRVISVLDADPELGQDVRPEEREQARRRSRAEVITWYPQETPVLTDAMSEPGAHGLLVLEGSAAGRFDRGGRKRAELVGPEDLLRPWVQLDDVLGDVATMSWEVLEPMRLAVLDRRWAAAMQPWPEVCGRLLDRLVLKSRRLCLQMIAAGHARGEDRVLLQLWQLAEQWGRVTPAGIEITVPVTHRLLAELTGSRRPTVTSAVGRLRRHGLLTPLEGRRFLLHGPAPQTLMEASPLAAGTRH
jgi:CRP/FNR family cyclic AMP-dependent transcriptional regulator